MRCNMELWIRSQDKMALTKFDLCILEKYDDKYMFIADHYKNMGTYKTKERALEVLDEIQNILEQILDPNITILPIFVYEMPEE